MTREEAIKKAEFLYPSNDPQKIGRIINETSRIGFMACYDLLYNEQLIKFIDAPITTFDSYVCGSCSERFGSKEALESHIVKCHYK